MAKEHDLNLRITRESKLLLIGAQALMMARLQKKVTMTDVVEEGIRLVAKREKVVGK